jgi:hypothetical protein
MYVCIYAHLGDDSPECTPGFAFGAATNVQQIGDESIDVARILDFVPDLDFLLGPPTGLGVAFRAATNVQQVSDESPDFTLGFSFWGGKYVQQMGDEGPDFTRSPDFASDLDLLLGPWGHPPGLV